MFKQKKIWALALTPVLFSLAGCRDDNMYSGGGDGHIPNGRMDPITTADQRIHMICAQLDAITVKNVHGTLGGKNPGYLYDDSFFISADFIYWKAQEEGLEFAMKGDTTSDQDFDDQDLSFKFDPGFRLGMGYYFGGYDQWDVYVNWTRFQNKAHKSISGGSLGSPTAAGLDPTIYPEWDPQLTGNLATDASAHWKLLMNTIDFELGRNFFVSKRLSMRPFCGVRAAWLHQHYEAEYNSNAPGGNVNVASPASFKAENEFNSGGLRGGFDFQWHFNENWNILTKVSGSLLYGHFEIDEKTDASAGLGIVRHWGHEYNRVRGNVEAFFGLQWEDFVFDNSQHVAISFGYEMAEWFSQNEMIDWGFIVNTLPVVSNAQGRVERRHGDLGIQGINLKFQYNF